MLDICIVTYSAAARDLERLREEISKTVTMPYEVFVLHNTHNTVNMSSARNIVANDGNRNFIAFLEPDVHLEPGWSVSMMGDLEARPDTGCVVPRMLAAGHPLYPDAEYNHKLAFHAVMMRRSTWKALCGFDERFRFFGADADFRKRLGVVERRDTRVALTAAMVHGRGDVIRKGVMAGGLDFAQERAHQRAIENGISDLSLKYWHDLDSVERSAVRSDPRYSMKGVGK